MEDHSRSHSHELFNILGFGSIRKACKSFVSKCYPEKKNSSFPKKIEAKGKFKSIQQDCKSQKKRISDKEKMVEMQDSRYNGPNSTRGLFKHKSFNNYVSRSLRLSPPMSRSISPSPLSRNASHNQSSFLRSSSRSQMMMPPARASLLRTMSWKNSRDTSVSSLPRSLSRSTSRKGSTRIMYSNSNGLIRPPAMEKQLECTLEEMCFGCIKKIKITRDTITDDGQIIEEDEMLTIKVKPGWRKGTKITFEGMGNETTSGTYPANVIFMVAEKQHHLYRREGDDLELGVEIPLVKALTGCTLSVPLLGGQVMNLTIDDVIYPGYEKIIAGQGMPKQNEPETRGNLIITFLVEFPKDLTEEQRSDIVNILQDT